MGDMLFTSESPHRRTLSYIKTCWVVDETGLSNDKKNIIEPFVLQQTNCLISKYYSQLNKIDYSTWSSPEIAAYLMKGNEDISFSEYARTHIQKMIDNGRERTSRDYKWALYHLERFAETDNLTVSRMTSSFLNRWIETLLPTARCKEKYPINVREMYKCAMKEYNDEERGIIIMKNPWKNVTIPKSDESEKRAIPVSLIRQFFQYIPEESRYRHPLREVAQDFALISFCMCGLNAADIFYAEKDQYVDGIFHYNRRKTKGARADNAYFEVRVCEFLKPTFEKYLSTDPEEKWLFNFHKRLSTEDSFCANLNTGLRQIWEKISPDFKASFYAFRHSWATIAQNECGANLNDVDFGLNHSTNKMARVYVKIDFSPAWILNEKVIHFVFFTNKDSKTKQKQAQDTLERISTRNLIRAEAYIMGNEICKLENTGFSNIDQIMNELLSMCKNKIVCRTKIQFQITNVDKQHTQMYQRIVSEKGTLYKPHK